MTWVVWRQHRTQLVAGAAGLAVLSALLLWTHSSMNDYARTIGLKTCLAGTGDCNDLRQLFHQHFESLVNNAGFFNLLPLLVGLFWGAPLVARELEQGTHRLAWTQSVTRRRWYLVRVVVLVTATVAAAVAFSTLFSWWLRDFRELGESGSAGGSGASRFSEEIYNFSGLAPVGYTLFALALGVAAGAVFKRSLVAMAVTVAVWLPLRIWFESFRSHLVSPLKVTYAPFATSPRAGLGDWVTDVRLVGPGGVPLPMGRLDGPCAGALDKGGAGQCLFDHGFRQVDTYQPGSRYWLFQSIEFAVFGGLALVLLVVAFYWVTRRVSR